MTQPNAKLDYRTAKWAHLPTQGLVVRGIADESGYQGWPLIKVGRPPLPQPDKEKAALAARIAVLLNATEGIPTEALADDDRNLLKQAAAALEGAAQWLDRIDAALKEENGIDGVVNHMPNNTEGRAGLRSLARKLRGDYDA